MSMQFQSSTRRQIIYLAGKIAQPDWRHSLVKDLWQYTGWGFNYTPLDPTAQWPIIPGAIFESFDYGGPFFTRFSDAPHRDIPPHGIQAESYPGPFCWKHSGDTPNARTDVITLCLNAIRRADLVFAWVDTLNCFGTLFELGYAKALRKPLAVYFRYGDFWSGDPSPTDMNNPFYDLWFPYFACDARHADNPTAALSEALHSLGWFWLAQNYGSPLEAMFAHEWVEQALHLRWPLTSQHPLKDGRYRLDFAYPPAQMGIELDGYTYHSDREAFTRDRQRQREIEGMGWRVIRFSGDELRDDIARCVKEAAHLLSVQLYHQRSV